MKFDKVSSKTKAFVEKVRAQGLRDTGRGMERLAAVTGYDEARLWAVLNGANTLKLSNGVVKITGFGSLSEQMILDGIKAIKGDGAKKAAIGAARKEKRQKAAVAAQAVAIAETLREYPALHKHAMPMLAGAQWAGPTCLGT